VIPASINKVEDLALSHQFTFQESSTCWSLTILRRRKIVWWISIFLRQLKHWSIDVVRTAPVSFSYACVLAFCQPWTVDGGIWSILWSAFHACCDSRLVAQLHPVDVTWTARADWCYCACARTLLGKETTAERYYLPEHLNSQHVMLCIYVSGLSTFDTRRTWNDELRCTLYKRIYGYKRLLKERVPVRLWLHDTRLRFSWHVTSSTQHVAGGSSSAVWLSSSATQLSSSSTWQAGSTVAARLPPSFRRLPSSVRHPLASTSHHWPATGQSHVMFLFAAALLCFSSIP